MLSRARNACWPHSPPISECGREAAAAGVIILVSESQPQVRRRGLQSTRRTATTMPAPAAGAANGLAVLSRASRPQPRPPMHLRRPCALIWSSYPSRDVGRLVDHPPACCQNMVNSCSMTCMTLLLAHARMAQPLAWSGGSLCVAYARASMPRVPRGPRRPPRHAWHRLCKSD